MYTQILKAILLTIDFEQRHVQEFITDWRQRSIDNESQLKNTDKFEQEYSHYAPIWWYTHDWFLYSTLNRVLRIMQVNIIISMGFFLRDLHQNIVELHLKQYRQNHFSSSFIVYHGQSLSETDFNHLLGIKGGLMSFNNFLSTILDQAVSLAFAESHKSDPELICVLFKMTIDPSISSTSFANIRSLTHYQDEEKILFSMQSVFRIEEVEPINNSSRLWQANLRLTGDTDPELLALTEHVRKETFPTTKGWYRLVQLLFK